MTKRKRTPNATETSILVASRRNCCLCFFLRGVVGERPGQIAHLNRDPSDIRFENLVWLCLEHHAAYDSTSRQSKGLTIDEVRAHRDEMYRQIDPSGHWLIQSDVPIIEAQKDSENGSLSQYQVVRETWGKDLAYTVKPWRFPLWQVANVPEYFAYKAGNRADGVCLVERIDLPDGRVVVACIETAGNPGQSITNCVETLCFQVCERFNLPANRVVWLQHYDYDGRKEWDMVLFDRTPPDGPFLDPKWVPMTPRHWRGLRLRPRKYMRQDGGRFESKITKLFSWETRGLDA